MLPTFSLRTRSYLTWKDLTGAGFDDPNLDKEHLSLEDESPYPEVRSAVANTDDPTIPVATLRAWVIGIIWSILIPGLNQFFFFRYPSVTITGIVAQLLSFPIGRAAAAFLPNWSIFGLKLNPGPFTVKEHVLVTVRSLSSIPYNFNAHTKIDNGVHSNKEKIWFANHYQATVGWQSAYATDIIAVQRVYYNQTYNFSCTWIAYLQEMTMMLTTVPIGRSMVSCNVYPADWLFYWWHCQTVPCVPTNNDLAD